MEYVHLKDIANNLDKVYVKLNPEFLRKLLVDSSNSYKPHLNKRFVESLGCNFVRRHPNSVISWLRGKRNIPLSKLTILVRKSSYTMRNIEENLIYLTSGSRKIHIKFPIKINKALGTIVGHVLGDGSIEKANLQLSFSNSNLELLSEFENCMFAIFQVKPRIWMQARPTYEGRTKWDKRLTTLSDKLPGRNVSLFYPQITSSFLHAIFGKFALGRNKEITSEIMGTPLDFKKSLIRAFADSEGSVLQRTIRLFQDDTRILLGIKAILNQFEIQTSPIKYYWRRNKRRAYFDITGYFNQHKFLSNIGFTSSVKRERLVRYLTSIRKRKAFRLRKGETKSNILKILGTSHTLSTKEIWQKLRVSYPDFKWDKSTLYNHLNSLERNKLISKYKVNNKEYHWNYEDNTTGAYQRRL